MHVGYLYTCVNDHVFMMYVHTYSGGLAAAKEAANLGAKVDQYVNTSKKYFYTA